MASQAIEAGRAFLKLLVEDSEFNKGLDRSLRKLDNFANQVGKIGLSLAALASPAVFAGVLAAGIEKSAAALSVFTGSAEIARDILIDLQKFSSIALVPFENLSTQVALLIRYGVAVEDATAFTKALTIVAAGNADEFDKLALAFAQVAGAGRLQGEEMRQLKNTAFNPLREIAAKTGETFDEVRLRMEAGAVSFEEVGKALLSATSAGGRFGGLLEKISQTAAGQFALAKAQVNLLAVTLGQQLLPAATAALRGVNTLLKGIRDLAESSKLLRDITATLSIDLILFAGILLSVASGIRILTFAVGLLNSAFLLLAAHPVVAALIAFGVALSILLTYLGQVSPQTDELNKRLEKQRKEAEALDVLIKSLEKDQKKAATATDTHARALALLTAEERKQLEVIEERLKAEEALLEALKLRAQIGAQKPANIAPNFPSLEPLPRNFGFGAMLLAFEAALRPGKGIPGGFGGRRTPLEEEAAGRSVLDTFAGRLAPQIFGGGQVTKEQKLMEEANRKADERRTWLQKIHDKIGLGPGFQVGTV